MDEWLFGLNFSSLKALESYGEVSNYLGFHLSYNVGKLLAFLIF